MQGSLTHSRVRVHLRHVARGLAWPAGMALLITVALLSSTAAGRAPVTDLQFRGLVVLADSDSTALDSTALDSTVADSTALADSVAAAAPDTGRAPGARSVG